MRPIRFALPVAALLALAACDYFGTQQEEAGDASGEVLPGSVSDEMIPVQDLKSQPPVLREQGVAGGSSAEAGADDSAAMAPAAADGEAAVAEDIAPAEAATGE